MRHSTLPRDEPSMDQEPIRPFPWNPLNPFTPFVFDAGSLG
jgi:hypothetical protein